MLQDVFLLVWRKASSFRAAPGSEERLWIYELYHLLNHLNLFGRGYRSSCVAILKRFA